MINISFQVLILLQEVVKMEQSFIIGDKKKYWFIKKMRFFMCSVVNINMELNVTRTLCFSNPSEKIKNFQF